MSRIGVAMAVMFLAASASLGLAQTAPKSEAPDEFLKGAYPSTTKDLVLPTATRRVDPKYTPEAMRAKIQGTVHLQIVVLADGTVGRARVMQSLDKGLDKQAIDAAKQWRFVPGKLKGETVAVAMDLILEFKLH